MRRFYLALAIVGFLLPMSQLVPFLRHPDIFPLFATPISSMFALDLVVSCIVFWAFVASSRVKHRWLYVVLTLAVGLSFALPLFLYAREGE